MCSTDNINRRLPPPKSRTTLAARRNTKKKPTSVQARASASSSKRDIRKGAASGKPQNLNFVASPDGRLRAAKPVSTTSPPPDGRSPSGRKDEGHTRVSKTILHRMLCIMQDMEADIESLKSDVASLKTSNKQQAKELAELRAKNSRLERDNEAFREEVESTLEVVEDAVTRNFKKGQEHDARVEGYMDDVCDELSRLDLRIHDDTLTATVQSGCDVATAASERLKQIELTHEITAAYKRMSNKHEGVPKKHGQMTEAFEALVPYRKSPLSPASSVALNMTTKSEATARSISTQGNLTIVGQDDESEDGTGMATPSPGTSFNTSATFDATGDTEAQSSQNNFGDDGARSNVGEGEDGWATPTLRPTSSGPPLPPVDTTAVDGNSTSFTDGVVVR